MNNPNFRTPEDAQAHIIKDNQILLLRSQKAERDKQLQMQGLTAFHRIKHALAFFMLATVYQALTQKEQGGEAQTMGTHMKGLMELQRKQMEVAVKQELDLRSKLIIEKAQSATKAVQSDYTLQSNNMDDFLIPEISTGPNSASIFVLASSISNLPQISSQSTNLQTSQFQMTASDVYSHHYLHD
ncbi:hypothetical protein M422DRAFT_36739 [Sphaerobolus stellatus SS14]|uniref:Uncharacterized protein n=1 Tax=Sphaerobolus stellatus (strain SS14) TaxID=990650 RepID=A0A0C9U6W6_SPHS4|nr:hypothetical protein M422DRAFT_36739 [Sphaerobolus stellatus SS14]